MNQTTKWVLLIVAAALIIWGLTALNQNQDQTQAPAQTVKIGLMAPLTGDAASYGEGVKKGAELAKKRLDMNIELVVEDTKCDGKEAASAANKLISVDKVATIIGELCSSATLAAAPVAEQNRVVLISPASTSPQLTTAGDYVFRTVPSDALQGDFGAKLVYGKNLQKLAVLYSNEDYGIGFNKVLTESFKQQGGEVVASEGAERGSTDLRTQLTKIKIAQPDAVYIITNSPAQAGSAIKQIRELGITASIFGAEGLKSDEVTTAAGSAAEGLIVSSVSSGNAEFVSAHKTEFNSEPGPFSAQGHDALLALAEAVRKGGANGEAIKNALYQVEFDGASGRIKFDANGDVAGNYDVYVVQNGQFVLSE